jgi:hypothetical protein
MDLSVRAGTTFTNGDQRWISGATLNALRHSTSTITLARSTFDLVTAFPNGFIPSGIVLGRITGAGATQYMYGPYADGATDGRQTAVGFLLTDVPYDRSSTANMGAALLWQGEVYEAYLPTGHGLDANGRTDLAAKFRLMAVGV